MRTSSAQVSQTMRLLCLSAERLRTTSTHANFRRAVIAVSVLKAGLVGDPRISSRISAINWSALLLRSSSGVLITPNETEISCGGRESAWPAVKAF